MGKQWSSELDQVQQNRSITTIITILNLRQNFSFTLQQQLLQQATGKLRLQLL